MDTTWPAAERLLIERVVRKPAFQQLTKLPLVAWQELLIIISCYAVVIGGGVLYWYGLVPYLLVLIASTVAMYASFTPLHDATHRSLSRHSRLNDWLGTLSAQLLLPGATTQLYRYLHLAHHRHTGDPELDPDEPMVAGKLWQRLLRIAFLEVVWLRWYLRHREARSGTDKLRDNVTGVVWLTWHIAGLLSPWAMEFVLLWLLPQRLGMLTVAYFFAAIQHPEGVLQKDQPLQATRMFGGGRIKRLVSLSQNEHLMHHLFPMVPFYRYHAAWQLSKPELQQQNLVWDRMLGANAMPASVGNRLQVRIDKLETVGEDILACTFCALDNRPLPQWTAGAHIDVHINVGNSSSNNDSQNENKTGSKTSELIRQYSLTGLAPKGQYSIAVKREMDGRGGSKALHTQFQLGQTLTISPPRNLFPLEHNHNRIILIAGGIGITPLLAMAQELHRDEYAFDLHVCSASQQKLPFADLLDRAPWANSVQRWISPNRISAAALPTYQPDDAIYLCGPAGFMQNISELAQSRGWPAHAIKTEHFAVTSTDYENAPFVVRLARSGTEFKVAADQSLLQALQQQQVAIPVSCSQGLCGTCACKVLDGDVEHRDQFFTSQQHAAGQVATCVSRARGGKLVLDL